MFNGVTLCLALEYFDQSYFLYCFMLPLKALGTADKAILRKLKGSICQYSCGIVHVISNL